LAGALQSFVAAYNSARGQVSGQVGPAAGLLSGHVIIRQFQTELRQIAGFRTLTGSVKNLTDLGIAFDTSGKASFDASTINGFSEAQLSSAFEFAGTASQGLGGFSVKLRQFSDPITGLIRTEQDGLDRIDRALQGQMSALTERIAVMRAGLAIKLQQADTLLATLESQQSTLKATLQGLSSVLYGRNDD
jgi:flagellar capping protein FliD